MNNRQSGRRACIDRLAVLVLLAYLASMMGSPASAQDLLDNSSLRGLVLESGSKRPLDGARVRVGELTATTDAEGAFVIKAVPRGSQTLEVSSEHHTIKQQPIFVQVGTNTITIELETSPVELSTIVV